MLRDTAKRADKSQQDPGRGDTTHLLLGLGKVAPPLPGCNAKCSDELLSFAGKVLFELMAEVMHKPECRNEACQSDGDDISEMNLPDKSRRDLRRCPRHFELALALGFALLIYLSQYLWGYCL